MDWKQAGAKIGPREDIKKFQNKMGAQSDLKRQKSDSEQNTEFHSPEMGVIIG